MLLGQAGGMGDLLIFLPLMLLIFYFLIIRPQKKKDKARRNLLESIKKGDRVVTIGGIHGEVENVKEHFVTLLVDRDQNVTLKMSHGAISRIVTPGSEDSSEEV